MIAHIWNSKSRLCEPIIPYDVYDDLLVSCFLSFCEREAECRGISRKEAAVIAIQELSESDIGQEFMGSLTRFANRKDSPCHTPS